MNEMKAQATAEYPVRAREELLPNKSAPVPFRVSRAGRFVDVVDLPPNVAVVQAALGRVRYSREEMKSSFAEFLALEPQEVKAGTYCVFTMMNVGAKPVIVTGTVIVEGEYGEAVEGLPLREATDNERPVYGRGAVASEASVSSGAPQRNAANDAMVDAIIDNATMADGTPMPKAKASKSSKSKSPKPATGPRPSTGRRPSPTPATAPMPRAGAMKPQKIMTRHARRLHYETQASTAKPGGEMRVILLHIGHVAMLDLSLTARVPLDEGVRGEISAAIHEARENVTADSVGVVAIHLSKVDCERLADSVDARVEYTLEDTEAMCAAIQQALEPKAATSVSVHGPSAERDERGASLEPEAVPAESTHIATESETTASFFAGSAGSAVHGTLVGVEKAEVGNVTPIHGKVQDDGRPQSRLSAPAKSVNEA